jgi:hypothetical protein
MGCSYSRLPLLTGFISQLFVLQNILGTGASISGFLLTFGYAAKIWRQRVIFEGNLLVLARFLIWACLVPTMAKDCSLMKWL